MREPEKLQKGTIYAGWFRRID